MPRLPYPTKPGTPNSRGQVLNIQRMLGHMSPEVQKGFSALSAAVLFSSTLNPALRELAVVRVGNLSHSPYELFHHEPFARHLGVSEAKIENLRGGDLTELSPVERAVIVFVDEIVRDVRPSDRALEGLRKHLSEGEILELVLTVGTYMTVCRLLETTGVELDATPLDTTPPPRA